MDSIANLVHVTVDPNGNYDDTSTSIDLIAGDGVKLPAAPFNMVWWNESDFPNPCKDPGKEIVRVTAISTDTLTITRAQEGTDAADHNIAGKTYAMSLGPTKKTIDDLIALLGDVFGSDVAVLVDVGAATIVLRQSGSSRYIQLSSAGAEIQATHVSIGDVNGEGNNMNLEINDSGTLFTFHGGQLASDQIQSASVAVGTLVGKLAIHDGAGDLVGYLPVYSSIT